MSYGCQVTGVSTSHSRRPNRRGEGSQLRADIVTAARELIEESGSAEAVTLRAVARRVGIAAQSIYGHFDSPEQIVRAVIAQTFEEFLRHLQAARAGMDEPRARLLADFQGYLSFGADSFELLVHDVAAATAAGASQSTDPFVTATAIWVALHGLVLLRADAPQFPWPDRTQLEDALLGRIALLEPNPA